MAEGVEHRQQDCHWQGHGDDERQAQHEDFGDHRPGQAFAYQGAEFLGHLADQHEAGQGREGEKERRHELPQEVAMEQAHGG